MAKVYDARKTSPHPESNIKAVRGKKEALQDFLSNVGPELLSKLKSWLKKEKGVEMAEAATSSATTKPLTPQQIQNAQIKSAGRAAAAQHVANGMDIKDALALFNLKGKTDTSLVNVLASQIQTQAAEAAQAAKAAAENKGPQPGQRPTPKPNPMGR